ncbi:MAG: cytochrome P450 [Anaerolineae bacterium]|nr:cytochrome P450 [Gemmatimonadaceae bacterium]
MILLLLESAVFALAGFHILYIATKAPFRRDAAEVPGLAIAVVSLGVVAAGIGIWMIVRWPTVRHFAAIGAVALMTLAWWRARPSYGARSKWPPGSLGIGKSLDAINDRTFYLDQAAAHGPVFKMSQFGRPVVCVVGLANARRLLNENADSLIGATLPYNRRLPKGTLRYMALSDHREEAPLFRKTFASLELHAGEQANRAACRVMLDTVVRESAQGNGGVRGREYFASWLLVSLSRIFFGLLPDDPRVAEIEHAFSNLQFDRSGGSRWQRRLEEALVSVTTLMRDVAAEGARSPDYVAAGSALRVILEADPALLDDPSRARNLFLVFRISHGDLTGLVDWLFKLLTDNPEWQSSMRTAGRTTGSPSSAQPSDVGSRIVLETLRMEQSEFLYRRIARPITFSDYALPEGWLLRICVQESHREPNVFPNPQRFDPNRFLARTFGKSEYSPFGADERGCMGARLALFLGRVFVEELCLGYEWQVTRDGPLERGSRHRHHWRPSAASRVILRSLKV